MFAFFGWTEKLKTTDIVLCTVLLVMAPAVAQEEVWEWPENLQLHGFLSQGYVKTSDNNFFGESSKGSWDFREIGANLSYQPQPNLLIAGQLLSRTAGELYDGSVRMDYGLVDVAAIMEPDLRLGVRAGRLKNPLGFYNDTRDVPFTRPSVFLPQSIYFDRVRNLELSTDGLGVYSDMQLTSGDLFLQLNYGMLDVDQNVEYAFMFQDWPGKLESDDPWFVGRLLYEIDAGRIRLAGSYATGELNYKPAPVDILLPGAISVDFWVLSFQYNEEYWSFTAEYMNEPINWKNFGPNSFFAGDNTAAGWYLQGAYRPHPDWELLLRYDVSYLNKHDKDGSESGATQGIPGHNFYAKDLTFGVRWDVTSSFMLRAEYHVVEGTSWLSSLETDPLTSSKYWDMFALLASYRF